MARFAVVPSGPPFDTLDSVLLDALPVAVYVCDHDARIIRLNPRAVELWGREPTPDDRYGGSLRMIRSDRSVLPHHECPMADVLRTGEAVRGSEAGIERPDGSRIVVRVTILPLTDESGTARTRIPKRRASQATRRTNSLGTCCTISCITSIPTDDGIPSRNPRWTAHWHKESRCRS